MKPPLCKNMTVSVLNPTLQLAASRGCAAPPQEGDSEKRRTHPSALPPAASRADFAGAAPLAVPCVGASSSVSCRTGEIQAKRGCRAG